MSVSKLVEIETSRFGTISVDEADLIHFPGIPGFPQAQRFVVMQHDQGDMFAWLVSLDVPDLAFVVTEPWQFFPNYDPPVDERQLRALGARSLQDLEVLAVVSFHEEKLTLNLAAPIVVHSGLRRGMQLILDGDAYSVRQELPVPEPKSGEADERKTG